MEQSCVRVGPLCAELRERPPEADKIRAFHRLEQRGRGAERCGGRAVGNGAGGSEVVRGEVGDDVDGVRPGVGAEAGGVLVGWDGRVGRLSREKNGRIRRTYRQLKRVEVGPECVEVAP